MERDAGEVLPVVGEASDVVWEAVSGGQPIVLTHNGEPAVVALDLDTYEAWQETTGTAP